MDDISKTNESQRVTIFSITLPVYTRITKRYKHNKQRKKFFTVSPWSYKRVVICNVNFDYPFSPKYLVNVTLLPRNKLLNNPEVIRYSTPLVHRNTHNGVSIRKSVEFSWTLSKSPEHHHNPEKTGNVV